MATLASEQLAVRVCDGIISAARKRTSSVHYRTVARAVERKDMAPLQTSYLKADRSQEQGKHIYVGGVDISSQLIRLGLVDEYRFVVAPIFAGEGRRLLEGVNLQGKLQLRLVESHIFKKSGCIALRYLKQ
jgi:dihydrofolate reductase